MRTKVGVAERARIADLVNARSDLGNTMRALVMILALWSAACLWAQPNAQAERDSLAAALRSAGTDSARVELLCAISRTWRHSDPARAQTIAQEALDLATSSRYRTGIAKARNLVGLAAFWQSHYAEALDALRTALSEAEQLKDTTVMGSVLVNLGLLHSQLDDLPRALAYYQRQAQLATASGDSLGVARAETNIGLLFRRTLNEPEAQRHLQRSLDIATALGDLPGMAITLNNVATGLKKLGQLDSARTYYREALRINTALDNARFVATNHMGLAQVEMAAGNMPVARAHADSALHLREQLGNPEEIVNALVSLCEIELAADAPARALMHARRAATLAATVRSPDARLQALTALGQVLERTGQHAEAASTLSTVLALRDSMDREAAVGKLARQQVAFEVAEKEERLLRLGEAEAEQRALAAVRARQRDRFLALAVGLLMVAAAVLVLYLRIRRLNRALAEARDRAEQNERAMDRFLAIMGHEVRSPMAGAISALDLARTAPSEERRAHYLRTAERAMRAQLRIVNDLLDRAAIEAGSLRIAEAPFSPAELLRDAVAPFEALASAKGLGFTLRMDRSLSTTRVGDAGRVAQVVGNLVGNAVKYTPTGTVSVEADQTTNGALRITVRDTGPGLTAEQQQQLFQAYARAEAQAGRDPGGTGLGLYVSAMLVKAMGGTVQVHSTPGQGSTFTVELPLPVAEERSTPTVGEATISYCIVDDDPMERAALVNLLSAERPGATVQVFTSAATLLEALAHRTPEQLARTSVFTDLDMPGMNGFELALTLRERHPNVPVVAVTASVLLDDAEDAATYGFARVMNKPMQVQALRAALEKLSPAP